MTLIPPAILKLLEASLIVYKVETIYFAGTVNLFLNNGSLVRDTGLALAKLGRSAGGGTDAAQVSSWVGSDLNNSGTARGSGADQVKGALYEFG